MTLHILQRCNLLSLNEECLRLNFFKDKKLSLNSI